MKWDKIGLFAGGVLFGTAGVKILSSKDAKKAYTHATAAVLRAKECVMTTATTIKENCCLLYTSDALCVIVQLGLGGLDVSLDVLHHGVAEQIGRAHV